MGNATFQLTNLIGGVRFIQGYRFLDRCGSALCRVEQELDEGWITGEPTPKGGQIKNYKLGMVAVFDAKLMELRQSEYISEEHFIDQSAKLLTILLSEFEVERIRTPVFRAIFQCGTASTKDSEDLIRSLQLMAPSGRLNSLMEGKESATTFTATTVSEREWEGISVSQRQRLETRSVTQERQPNFDERILQRVGLLPWRERNAMSALRILRKSHPQRNTNAADVDIEVTFEEPEMSAQYFPFHLFLRHCLEWAKTIEQAINTRPS